VVTTADRQTLIQIVPVEVKHVVSLGIVEDAAQDQVEVDRKDVALDGDAVARMPVKLLRDRPAGDTRRPLLAESLLLVFRDAELAAQDKNLVGLDAKPRKHVLGAVVDVFT